MSNVSADEIVRLVARAFGLAPQMMRVTKGQPAKRMVPSAARDAAAYLLRRHTSASYGYVGRLLGITGRGDATLGRTHVEYAEALLKECEEFAAIIERLESEIDALHEARCDPDHVSAGAAHRLAEVML